MRCSLYLPLAVLLGFKYVSSEAENGSAFRCGFGNGLSSGCSHGEICLVDGKTKHTGRLQICYDGRWGSVCDDLFDDVDASVACRQLGYKTGGSVLERGFTDGGDDLPTLMDDVKCNGNESRLIDCDHQTENGSNCVHSEDVGLQCGRCTDGGVRLQHGNDDMEGVVELCVGGKWGAVCNEEWDNFDATVVCRQLGFQDFSLAKNGNQYTATNVSAHTTSVSCSGSESQLTDCTYTLLSGASCSVGVAGVECQTTPCNSGQFWCPESEGECISHIHVCNHISNCSQASDERDCASFSFSNSTYYVNESAGHVSVCVTGEFPANPLFSSGSIIPLTLTTMNTTASSQDYDSLANYSLELNRSDPTECVNITIVDDADLEKSEQFLLVLNIGENTTLNFYQNLTSTAVVKIVDNDGCSAKEFFCYSRQQCLPLSRKCDGVLDCFHCCQNVGTDESDCRVSCEDGAIQLIEWSEGEGAVEVCQNGRFHRIESPGWDQREATVVCRKLHPSRGQQEWAGIEQLTPVLFSFSLTETVSGYNCRGDETDIRNCTSADPQLRNSTLSGPQLKLGSSLEDESLILPTRRVAGVKCITADNCTEGELRIVGGETEGRVEVCHNHLWGAITVKDGEWGLAEAGVVCRERGFEPAGAIAQTSFNPDLYVPEVTWPATLRCSGSESILQQCNIAVHDKDFSTHTAQPTIAGYKCRDLPRRGCGSEKFRLSEMTRHKGITSGLLEVCQNDTWMSVCNTTWSEQSQQEVCKQLSHIYSTPADTKVPLFPLYPPLAAVTLREECIGRNDAPPQCTHPPPPSSPPLSAHGHCQSWTRLSCVELPSISFYPLGMGIDRTKYILNDEQHFLLTCSTDHFDATSTRVERGNVTVAKNGSNMITVLREELVKEVMADDEEVVYQCVVETGRQLISSRNFSVSIKGKSNEWSTVHLRFSTILINELPLLNLVQFWLLDLINLQLEGTHNVNCSLLDQMRQEDIERELSRIECVFSVYPPTEEILEVAKSIAKTLPKIHPGFSSVNISSKGFCNAAYDELESGWQVYWPEAKAGYGSITRPCPGSGHRITTRKCNQNSIWTPPDYRSCYSIEDIRRLISNVTADNVVEVLDLLRIIISTAPAEEQNSNAVMIIATAFHNVSNVLMDDNSSAQLTVEERKSITADSSLIIDSLLNWNRNVLRNNGSEIVRSFEDILEDLITSEDFEALDVIGDNIYLLAETVSPPTYMTGGVSFFVTKQEEKFNISLDAVEESSSTVASGTLPDTLFQFQSEEKRVGLSFFIYEESFLFPLPLWSSNESGKATLVGTPVVSLIVAEGSAVRQRSRIDPPVVINLTVTQVDPKNVTDIHCVFWNFETEEWDSEGCETYPADDKSRVSCKCNHLTNFAALVDICRRTEGCETSSKAEYALSILSIAGVSLSLVGLVATIFTMSFFKRLRKRDATKFHIQLCVAMFCMLLVFLSGMRRSYARESCITISVLIHYFTLATVLWMGAEAVLMFRKLVIVFVRITRRYLIIVSIICWVIPIVPAAIPVAINPSYVIIEPERGRSGFCFISNTTAFFAAFLAPILAVILFNSVIFITVVVVLIRHKYNTDLGGAKKKKERGTTLRLIISIIGIMSIYGLTWLFGALTVDDASLAFQIIFVILNSLQGFFIFLFFCVLGREGRELWIETLFCGKYKSSYLHPSSASSTGGRYGRKNSRFLSTSGPVSVVEKTLSCTDVGASFVINYLELETKRAELKAVNGKIVIKAGIDKEDKHPAFKPNEKSVADKINGTSSHNNGTMHSTHLNGHAKTLANGHSNGEIVSTEPPEESSMPTTQEAMMNGEMEGKAQAEGVLVEEEPTHSKSADPELNPQLGRCSSRTEGKDPAETYKVDFDNATVHEV